MNVPAFSNSFRLGTGHLPPYLAGRQEEQIQLQRLLTAPPILKNMVWAGLRGIGKTALLELLRPLVSKRPWLWVGSNGSELHGDCFAGRWSKATDRQRKLLQIIAARASQQGVQCQAGSTSLAIPPPTLPPRQDQPAAEHADQAGLARNKPPGSIQLRSALVATVDCTTNSR